MICAARYFLYELSLKVKWVLPCVPWKEMLGVIGL